MSAVYPDSTSDVGILETIATALSTTSSELDLNANFVGNGGDSIASLRLQAALKAQGVILSIGSIFTATSLSQLVKGHQSDMILVPHDIAQSSNSPSLGQTETQGRFSTLPDGELCISADLIEESGEVDGRSTRFAATEMQSSLVKSTLSASNRNIIVYYETHRTEYVPALRNAWERVIREESIFHASFEFCEDGVVYLRDNGRVPFQWEEVVVHNEARYQDEINSCLPHGNTVGSSFKVVTFRRDSVGMNSDVLEESTVIWRVHHALIDGFSCDLVRAKVQRILTGAEHDIQPGPSFHSFVSELHKLQTQGRDFAVSFWERQAKNHPAFCTKLPFPAPKSDIDIIPCGDHVSSLQYLAQVHRLHNTHSLETYAKAVSVTVPSLYYAAWGIVMSRYTDSHSISFGAVLSGRSLPIDGALSVVGPTMNTLPIFINLDTNSDIDLYVRQVFKSLMDLTTFQWSMPSHGFSRNFSCAVNVRLGGVPVLRNDGPFSPIGEPHSKVLSDVPLQVEILHGGRICFSYDTRSFMCTHIERLATSFVDVLDTLVQSRSTVSACLSSAVGPSQLRHLGEMGNWNAELSKNGSIKEDIISLFLRTSSANSSATAVEHGAQSMTYAELQKSASQVAQHLSTYIDHGDVICVNADGTIGWIVATIAVLMAGAVYCPLDPVLPRSVRCEYYTTARAALFLSGSEKAISEIGSWCPTTRSVERLLQQQPPPGSTRSTSYTTETYRPRPRSGAYLCFTSGSTGRPKGVMCRHQGLVAFQTDLEVRLGAAPGWRIAQLMSPAFDGSIHEIFSALTYGAQLVLKDNYHPFGHLETCDAAILTPTVVQALSPTDFPRLKRVYLVGEAVPQHVCDAWGTQKELFNMYGPTEATCGATIKRLHAKEPVTLGNPNPSTRLYILDNRRRLAPWGVVGEIYLAGCQVATGYIDRPEETAQRFFLDSVNPCSEEEYMYSTGDRAYWNESGEIVYIGRRDRQIKLGGFRIDLDDLEIRLTAASKDCTAAAVARRDDHLVALVQPVDLDVNKLMSKIQRHIPPYALPKFIVPVRKFPVTSNGKLDYKAITSMAYPEGVLQRAGITGHNHSASVEQSVIASVREVLGVTLDTEVCEASNLCDLGSNSIVALALSRRLSRRLKFQIPIRWILESHTVGALVQTLATVPHPHTSEPIKASLPLGEEGVSPVEEEWWHKYDKATEGRSSFTVSYASRLGISVNLAKLVSAWNRVLGRHMILRCRYRHSALRGVFKEYRKESPVVKEVEIVDIQQELSKPFELAVDDLIRVWVSPQLMLVAVSHIICDLTTLKILLREVADSYHDRILPATTHTYSDTVWTVATPSQLQFWEEYLNKGIGHPKGSSSTNMTRQTWSGASVVYPVPANLYLDMMTFSLTKNVTMHQLALGSVAIALCDGAETCDITLGAPYFNRGSEEDLNTVGLFLEPIPIRIHHPMPSSGNISGHGERNSFITSVQRSSRAALSHAVPWNQLVSHFGIKPDFPNHPIFDAMVSFHEAVDEIQLDLPVDEGHFIPTWTNGAKFKIMAEFTARRTGELSLRMEYSDEIYDECEIESMSRKIIQVLESLVSGEDSG